jgi:hypothetical protein
MGRIGGTLWVSQSLLNALVVIVYARVSFPSGSLNFWQFRLSSSLLISQRLGCVGLVCMFFLLVLVKKKTYLDALPEFHVSGERDPPLLFTGEGVFLLVGQP